MELRAYESGDDIRRIDWKSTAKMGQPYVKEFVAERELNVVVILLVTGSMHFGLDRFKSDVAKNIVSLLGYSALKNSDRFSFISYDKDIAYIQKGSKKISSLYSVLSYMDSLEYLKSSIDMGFFEKKIVSLLKRKSLIFILGDFVGDFSFAKLSKRHEVIPIIIRDSAEEEPPKINGISLIDPVNFNQNDTVSSFGLKEYKRLMEENDKKLYSGFIKNGMRFLKIKTDDDEFMKLKRFFRGR